MTGDIILPILKNIQQQVQEIKTEQVNTNKELQRLRSDFNMQFYALNDKLNGHLVSELELRNEFNNLVERVQVIERRLELRTET